MVVRWNKRKIRRIVWGWGIFFIIEEKLWTIRTWSEKNHDVNRKKERLTCSNKIIGRRILSYTRGV